MHRGSYDELQALLDALDPDVVAGDEWRAVRGARAPELAVDLHEPVPPHDALVADEALCADRDGVARRTLTTRVSAKPSSSASVPAIATATGSDTWYASPAGSKSISAPSTNRIAPAA